MSDDTCKRCDEPTDETTLSGERLCSDCQDFRANEDTTRPLGQSGLDSYDE